MYKNGILYKLKIKNKIDAGHFVDADGDEKLVFNLERPYIVISFLKIKYWWQAVL